jgi:hypothetical protein
MGLFPSTPSTSTKTKTKPEYHKPTFNDLLKNNEHTTFYSDIIGYIRSEYTTCMNNACLKSGKFTSNIIISTGWCAGDISFGTLPISLNNLPYLYKDKIYQYIVNDLRERNFPEYKLIVSYNEMIVTIDISFEVPE